MTNKMAIEIKGLTKSYGPVHALRGVNLQVSEGMIFGFLGPNGAGKTTTIRCMLDLIRPDSGAIRVLGLDPQGRPVEVRRLAGYLPGELHIEANLNSEKVFKYLASLRSNRVDFGFVRQLAERLELDLEMPIRNLSKGNKQKVGVIQALMSKPKLLILDEPTSGLDPLMQREVYRLLREAKEDGATVFFSSHIMGEVEQLAERIAIIRQGWIVQEAAPFELMNLAIRRLHVRFLEDRDASQLADLNGVTLISQNGDRVTLQVEGEMDSLIKALGSFPIRDIDIERPSLEEVFLRLYEDKE